MKGLLTKEWCVIMKNSVPTFIIVALFFAIGALGKMSFMLVYVAMLLGMIPVNYMTFDETSRWQQYSLSLPYKRSSIVSAKYVVMLIFALISTAVMAVGLIINMMRNGGFDLKAYALELTIPPAIGILIPSLTFPLNFKFGTGKGRLVMLIVVCFLAGGLGSFISIDHGNFQGILLKKFAGLSAFQFIPMILGGLAVVCFLSWLVSVRIFEKKDL